MRPSIARPDSNTEGGRHYNNGMRPSGARSGTVTEGDRYYNSEMRPSAARPGTITEGDNRECQLKHWNRRVQLTWIQLTDVELDSRLTVHKKMMLIMFLTVKASHNPEQLFGRPIFPTSSYVPT